MLVNEIILYYDARSKKRQPDSLWKVKDKTNSIYILKTLSTKKQ